MVFVVEENKGLAGFVVYGFFSVAYCMFRVTEPFRVVFIPNTSRVRFLKFSSTLEALPASLSIICSRA